MLCMEVKKKMAMAWLISLVAMVILLLIIASLAPGGDRQDRPPSEKRATSRQPDSVRPDDRKAA
jgi:hypothetical protein